MNSITSRLLLGTGLLLAVFVALTALSVSYAVHRQAETARIDSLRGLVYGILGATDIDGQTQLAVNDLALPDQRLNQTSSGLAAEIISNTGETLWSSDSVTANMPATMIRPIGDWYFETVQVTDTANSSVPVHRLQLSTAWEFDNGEELPFIVHVVDFDDSLSRQLKRFDRTLWVSLLATSLVLLCLLLLVLRQSLKPLHRISDQLTDIENGQRDQLSDDVPVELLGLSSGLNALLRAERQRHEQYRHLLGDLSHHLKTPLSVLTNLADSLSGGDGADTIRDQTAQMQRSLERYSQRARIRAPRYLSPNVSLRPFAQRVIQSLNKLYREPAVQFNLDVPSSFVVRMDEADLLEVLGNVLENACKYGARHIHIHQNTHQDASPSADQHQLYIDDDGPGFPMGDLQQFTQRGVRADTTIDGSGTGLAVTEQILANYGGSLRLDHSPSGGARVILQFG